MDEPASLVDEWQRKMVFPALEQLYDEIWVYGLPPETSLIDSNHATAGGGQARRQRGERVERRAVTVQQQDR